jgi:gliding motility-associated-like protein
VVNGNSDTVFKQICVGDSVVLYNKSYKTEGFYTVLYSKGSTGCDSTIILKLSVMPLPLAGITASSDLVTPNTTVQLQTPFNSNYAYAWLPIDLISSSTIYNPTTQLTQNTWYYVNVTDRNNCKNKDSILIRVQQNNCDAEFFIPNAFSPNGDGINDIFRARYPCPVEEYYMIVYNRWGLKVFESNDINLGWDGRYNGEREQAEVYAFYVEYKPVGSAIKIAKKGNVTLLE